MKKSYSRVKDVRPSSKKASPVPHKSSAKSGIKKLFSKVAKALKSGRGRRSTDVSAMKGIGSFEPGQELCAALAEDSNLSVATQAAQITAQAAPVKAEYNLPVKYADDRIVLMPRDPWWIYSYWDISEGRINSVISSIPVYERQNLKWTLRAYDVTMVSDFNGANANSYFDLDVNYEAGNWYINVNQPERDWCAEIGLKNPEGKFFPVARSNFIKTPYFGVSGIIDEEWAVADEDYYKLMGGSVLDIGRSSFQRRKQLEELVTRQISSPLSSWGGSGAFGKKEQDKFFLEVWTELILYGRTEADAEVIVEGKKVQLRPDGTFSLRYALPVGDYKFEVAGTSKNKKHKIKKTPAVKRFDK